MKRTIAAGLSAALLCGMVVPAFAADTKTATNTTGTTQTNQGGTSGSTISSERAKEIALAEVPGGTTVVKCQLDWDDGRQVYELELRNGRTEYDFEIDAQTGDIVSRDVDYDD